MKRFPSIIVFCLAFFPYAAQAQSEWIYSGGGARACGMGGAFTAVSDDVTALAWNPAGLGQIRNLEILYGRGQSAADPEVIIEQTALCLPLILPYFGSLGTLGYSAAGYKDIHRITGVSYGMKIPFLYPHINIGASLKYLEQNTGVTETNVSADLGMLVRLKCFCLGIAVLNYAGKEFDLLKAQAVNLSGAMAITDPPLLFLTKYRFGAAWNSDNFTADIDLEKNLDTSVNALDEIPWQVVFSTAPDVIKKAGFELCVYGKTRYTTQEVPKPVQAAKTVKDNPPGNMNMEEYYRQKGEKARGEYRKQKKEKEETPEKPPELSGNANQPGLEYKTVKVKIIRPTRVFIRAGYVIEGPEDAYLTCGIGLVLKYLKLDLAGSRDSTNITASLRF